VERLRLAVDARTAVEDTRGIGRYLRAILRRLAPREDVELVLVVNGLAGWGMRSALEHAIGSHRFRVSRRAPRSVDVMWHPANGTFFKSKAPSIATVHDAVPFRYPKQDQRHRQRDQEPFLRSVQTARRIIAVSNFGADEVHAVFGVPRDRISVIYHGVATSFAPGECRPPAPLKEAEYLLFIGDPIAEPRKNFELLYEAYMNAWPNGDAPPIAIAAKRAPELPGVVHAGLFSDDLDAEENPSLRNLYRGALALVVPSYHETFGMPVLEAMACGIPVVASAAGSLPEIAGDAVLLVSPRDANAWADALLRISSDGELRASLIAKGLERAKQFHWNRSAQQHVDAFRSVASNN
jgi:glycosyltransferase involved in cell wall biosynthesis